LQQLATLQTHRSTEIWSVHQRHVTMKRVEPELTINLFTNILFLASTSFS
jgi:hypothetical protein